MHQIHWSQPREIGIMPARMLTQQSICCTGADPVDGVAWFVQVSDLHLSRFATQQLPKFGDKVSQAGPRYCMG